MSIALRASAPITVPAPMPSMMGFDPRRGIRTEPAMAPTTPPRLKAMIPALPNDGSKPAPVNMEGIQLIER
jgi:hypothetical protein